MSTFPRVVTVAESGADHQTIAAAVDEIVAAEDNTATTPYVIDVGPGTYDGRFSLPSYTTLRGAGPDATRLTAHVASSGDIDPASVVVDISNRNQVTVRDVSVHVTIASGSIGAGMNIVQSRDVTVSNVTIVASSPSTAIGIYTTSGLAVSGTTPHVTVTGTRITATGDTGIGIGIFSASGSIQVTGSHIIASSPGALATHVSQGRFRISTSTLAVDGSGAPAALSANATADIAVTNSELVSPHHWLTMVSNPAFEQRSMVVTGSILTGSMYVHGSVTAMPRCAGSLAGDGTALDSDCQ